MRGLKVANVIITKSYQLTNCKLLVEREENVKSDIFHAYMALLRQTKSTGNISLDPNAMIMDDEEETPMSLLQGQMSLLVKGIQQQMKEKSMKTRYGGYHTV